MPRRPSTRPPAATTTRSRSGSTSRARATSFHDGDVELLPGVRLVATPGHSPGHQSLLVDDADGRTAIVGQALWSRAEWDGSDAVADSGAASAWDPVAYRSSVERLRAFEPDVVLFGHDRSVVASRVRAGTRTCGDVWFRQGLAIGEREPRTPLGLVNHVAKRSTWQPPVDSRPRCLGSKVSVEAASASRAVEASCSEAAIRTSVT